MRVGTTTTMDSLPMWVSCDAKAFEGQKVSLEIETFQSLDQMAKALETGELDAAILDLPTALLTNKDGQGGVIVRVAMKATPERSMYSFVALRKNLPASLKELQPRGLAVPSDLGSRYAADVVLSYAGLNPGSAHKIAVNGPDQALEFLKEEKVAAAFLPESMASWIVGKEIGPVTYSAFSSVGETVVVVRRSFLQEYPRAVRGFLVAYEAGVRALLFDAPRFRGFLSWAGGIPSEFVETFPIPLFPLAEVPLESELESTNQWLIRQGLLASPIPYQEIVKSDFLPDPSLVELALFCH